jgi:hypothetical protein
MPATTPVNADRHQQGDRHERQHAGCERRRGDRAERDHDDLGRQDEVGAHGPTDLARSNATMSTAGSAIARTSAASRRASSVGARGNGGRASRSLVAQEGAAQHQQRRDRPARHGADQQGERHEDRLVEGGSLRYCPHDRQLSLGDDAGHLLGVEGQVVTEHPGGLLGRDLRQYGDVVEQRRQVVEESEKCGACHARTGRTVLCAP